MTLDDPDARKRSGTRGRLRGILVDVSPLRRSPAFARLWTGTALAQVGSQVTVVAVGIHVYALTHDTLAVALVALWALGPMVLAGLLGGSLADTFDRRLMVLGTATISWFAIGIMTTIAFLEVSVTWPYYALAAVKSVAATVMGIARGAILPRILPTGLLPAAVALGSISVGIAVTAGPALAGAIAALFGFAWTYLVEAVLLTAAFVWFLRIPSVRPDRGANASNSAGLSSVVDSLKYLRHAPNVRATFIFDLIAMTLGQPRVVFPAAGALVLGGEAVTVGALTVSFAAGALLSGLMSGPLGRVRYHGRAITVAILAYGFCTAAFGLVLLVTGATQHDAATPNDPRDIVWPALLFACLALAGAGASDNVSSVFRTTILQTAVPDDVRGRMQGIFFVVTTGGPRLGDLLAGALATALALWAPALIGGLLIAALMLVLIRVHRGFQQYDAANPAP